MINSKLWESSSSADVVGARVGIGIGIMKFLYLINWLLATCVVIWAASEESSSTADVEEKEGSASKIVNQQQPGGFRLVSFDAVGNHVALGLDYLLPFIEVPIKRKRNAAAKPLVVVNSAAIISCVMMVIGGMFAGHLVRSLGLEVIEGAAKSKTSAAEQHTARALHLDEEQNFLHLFENFKLIYRNGSRERVETALPNLFSTIETTFLENDINLASCILKSICGLIYQANTNVRSGQATDLERLVHGAVTWSWLFDWLQSTALREAVEAGRIAAPQYCNAKYPSCRWATPEQQLLQIVRSNIEF